MAQTKNKSPEKCPDEMEVGRQVYELQTIHNNHHKDALQALENEV